MPKRVFQAINGLELAQVIGHEVTQALLRDRHFRQHITYVTLSFTAQIEVRSYPAEPPSFKVQVGETAPPGTILPETEEVVFRVTGGDPPGTDPMNTPPDLIRMSAGVPVTEPTRVEGRIVDKPQTLAEVEVPEPAPRPRPGAMDAPVPDLPPREEAPAAGAVLDMPEGEPSFARSVELKTRTAPRRAKKE